MTHSARPFHLRTASRTFTLRTAVAFLVFSLILGSMSGLACAGRAVAAEAVGYLADDAFFSGGLGHGIDLGRRNLTGKGGTHKGSEPTDPAGDSTAPARSTITLLIAGGPTGGTDLVDVPSVVGLSQAEAEAAIRNAGLVPTVSLRPGPAEQVGEVIEQQPSGQATDGSTVTLVVGAESSGGELDGGAAGDTQGGTAGL